MTRTMHLSFVLLALVGAAALVGCKDDAKDQPAAPGADADGDAAPDVLAGLSAADRAAVLAQRNCPVTGEALDSMDGPIKLTIDGRDVFICCEGCRESLEADPARYFAILDGAAAEAGEAAEDAATDEADEAEEPAAEGEADDDAAEDEAAEPAESAATS
jgi:Cu(I)/Ag(I) efflux system membrane fusion protein